MASYTTNLNLKKPAGSENVAIGDINNNMDTIDAAYGTLNSNKVDKDSRVLIDRTTSSTLSDCNDVTQAGMYRVISSTANRPSNISYGVLVHLMSNDYLVQFIIGTNGVFASRGKASGSWGSWQ
ncbi:MAG: hypothetical protein J6U01_06425 [Clostridia bacterium]|nr:hypothetical protein [Clostridia bacterium]